MLASLVLDIIKFVIFSEQFSHVIITWFYWILLITWIKSFIFTWQSFFNENITWLLNLLIRWITLLFSYDEIHFNDHITHHYHLNSITLFRPNNLFIEELFRWQLFLFCKYNLNLHIFNFITWIWSTCPFFTCDEILNSRIFTITSVKALISAWVNQFKEALSECQQVEVNLNQEPLRNCVSKMGHAFIVFTATPETFTVL